MHQTHDGSNIKLVDLLKLVGTGLSLICCLVIRGSTCGFLFLRYLSDGVSHPRVLQVSVESSSLTHHRPYSLFVCFLYLFIDGKETFMRTKMFRTTAEAFGEILNPVKLV